LRHLYLKIYLAFLAILAVFGLLLAGLWWITPGGHEGPRYMEAMTALVELALGPGAQQRGGLQSNLEHIARRMPGQITVRSAEGELLANAGPALTWPEGGVADTGVIRLPSQHPVFALKLEDGRVVLVHAERRPRITGLVAAVLLLFATMAIGSYFVVRRITARLERLRDGVQALGEGDLEARVEAVGRDEVARLAESFNHAAGRIEQLVAAHRELLANVSHELRTPLSRMRMALELLPEGTRPELRHRLGRDIAELDHLVGELLMSSRLQAGAVELETEELDLLALCAEEGAAYDAVVTGTSTLARCDDRLTRRVVRNLLENAMRYGGSGPTELEVSTTGSGQPRIRVMDRGPGVPPELRERIFEPFFRVPGTRDAGTGAGLGLSLVKQIARGHGGDARCLEREGGGSIFEVIFARLSAAGR
jgi:signal transduction histidine kinase